MPWVTVPLYQKLVINISKLCFWMHWCRIVAAFQYNRTYINPRLRASQIGMRKQLGFELNRLQSLYWECNQISSRIFSLSELCSCLIKNYDGKVQFAQGRIFRLSCVSVGFGKLRGTSVAGNPQTRWTLVHWISSSSTGYVTGFSLSTAQQI